MKKGFILARRIHILYVYDCCPPLPTSLKIKWSLAFSPSAAIYWISRLTGGPTGDVTEERTKAFIVPWRACRWFLLNFGSVPLRDGYREVFGFLILERSNVQIYRHDSNWHGRLIPVPMSLSGLIVLRRVLRFWQIHTSEIPAPAG